MIRNLPNLIHRLTERRFPYPESLPMICDRSDSTHIPSIISFTNASDITWLCLHIPIFRNILNGSWFVLLVISLNPFDTVLILISQLVALGAQFVTIRIIYLNYEKYGQIR